MRMFDKLFPRKRPKGAYESARSGAKLRGRFFAMIEETEAKLGEHAIGIATAEGVLMVHPKLEEELRKQPDADILEVALRHCFVTTDARRSLIESWPSHVTRYRGKANSDETLGEKSGLLSAYVVNNPDAEKMANDEIFDDRVCVVRVEEAALWYRVLDELAFRSIGGQRGLFMSFLEDDLAFNLALLGSSPSLIAETIATRSREYAEYRQWVPAEGAGAKGTLLWEAAKHVGEPIGLNRNPFFLMQFGTRFLKKLSNAFVRDLLVGKEVS